MSDFIRRGSVLLVAAAVGLTGCSKIADVESTQRGFRGVGLVQLEDRSAAAATRAANVAPAALPAVQAEGPLASDVYQNIQVLKDLTVPEFTRIMTAMTAWVSPEQGCGYCHVGDDLASDNVYTKVVSRRMLEMTRHINGNWKTHVGETGVTCYTCHRGKNVPLDIWFKDPGPREARGLMRGRAGQNTPAPAVGLTSLPFDPFERFLRGPNDIRVVSTAALPSGSRGPSIKYAEATYAMMMHMSQALNVNCTYCHNTRSFAAWDQSSPQRTTAWYGIRLVQDLNANYLEPLQPEFPANRLGPTGDVPKTNCASCHKGAYQPLFGAQMAKDYPELHPPVPRAAPTEATPEGMMAPDPAVEGSTTPPAAGEEPAQGT